MDALKLSDLGGRARPPAITQLMSAALETPGLLSLAAGFTDNRLLPVAEVREAVEELEMIAKARPGGAEHLQYGTNAGRCELRARLAERLLKQDGAPCIDENALAKTAEQVFVTNGSQQALYLAIQTLCEPGDIVLVDRPSYFVFLELLAGLGVRPKSMPVLEDGSLDVFALEALLKGLQVNGERRLLKAVYFVSWFANPSGRSWSRREKELLAETLRRHDCIVPIIEDGAYRDLGFLDKDAWAQSSILGDSIWVDFPRLYTGTLTKPFATGLKVGYGVCDNAMWRQAMLSVKGHQDFGSANLNQAIAEKVLYNGGFERRLTMLRSAYRKKRDVLDEVLRNGGLVERGWRWNIPEGGLYLWLTGPAQVDTRGHGQIWRSALAEGVLYVPGDLCFGDAPQCNTLRLSYGVLNEADLSEAGRRLCRALLRPPQ